MRLANWWSALSTERTSRVATPVRPSWMPMATSSAAHFDGNWEAMSGDIAFEDELQRTISVDIRYVLWILDKFAGADNLVNEMDLVKGLR
jgi:hypothetical protein